MSILLVFHSGFIFSSIILYIYPMRVLFCLFIHLSLSNLLYLSFPQYTTTCILFLPSRVLNLSFVHSCISCIPSFTTRPSFLPQLPAVCEWDRGSSLRSIFPLSSDPPRFIIQRCTGKLQVNLSYLWQDNGISRPYVYTLLIGDLKKCSSFYCLF